MKAGIYLLLAFSLSYVKSHGQSISRSVISPLGKEFSSANVSGSYTVGETVVYTFLSEEFIVSQGYQQSELSDIISGIKNLIDISADINAYPNPVKSILHIQVNTVNQMDYSINLFDINGKKVFRAQIEGSNQVLDMDLSGLMAGSYLLNLLSNDNRSYGFLHIVKL